MVSFWLVKPKGISILGDSVWSYYQTVNGKWASYQIRKIAGCACTGNAGNVFPCGRLQRKPLASDPGRHHGTCMTHVLWCMSGSLTRGGRENFPSFPAHVHPQCYVSGKRPIYWYWHWSGMWGATSVLEYKKWINMDKQLTAMADYKCPIRSWNWDIGDSNTTMKSSSTKAKGLL